MPECEAETAPHIPGRRVVIDTDDDGSARVRRAGAFLVGWLDPAARYDSKGTIRMRKRITNPVRHVPGALEALQSLGAAVATAGISESTLQLVHLRVSQINGCSVCVDIHSRALDYLDVASERLHTVAAWRDAPYFTDAERAALALAEAATRLADRPDPVPDEIWNEAARHYSEAQLAALLVAIATINAFNRLNVAAGQIGGEWTARIAQSTIQPAESPIQPAAQSA